MATRRLAQVAAAPKARKARAPSSRRLAAQASMNASANKFAKNLQRGNIGPSTGVNSRTGGNG